LDASLQTGFRWLLRIIGRMWIELDGRVTADVERKSEHEKREKTERAKRVQRSRELRFTHLHNCFTALFWYYHVSPSFRNPPNLCWLGTGTKYAGLRTPWLGSYLVANSGK